MGAPRKGEGARLPEPVVHGDAAGILRGLSAPVNRITMDAQFIGDGIGIDLENPRRAPNAQAFGQARDEVQAASA